MSVSRAEGGTRTWKLWVGGGVPCRADSRQARPARHAHPCRPGSGEARLQRAATAAESARAANAGTGREASGDGGRREHGRRLESPAVTPKSAPDSEYNRCLLHSRRSRLAGEQVTVSVCLWQIRCNSRPPCQVPLSASSHAPCQPPVAPRGPAAVWGAGFTVKQGLRLRVWGLGFTVKGLECRVHGEGFGA